METRIALPPTITPEGFEELDPHAGIVELAGLTMGTTWRVKLAGTGAARPEALRRRIAARLAGLVAEMSHWETGSLLSRFNRAAGDAWFTLPQDFATVIATGLRIAAESGGAFDPAIGALVDLWGFGSIPAPTRPDEAALAGASACSGWRRLAYDPDTCRLRQPGALRLDLSGIAKGHAVDAVVDLLLSAGIRHCLVEIGGELAGRGMRPDGDPWWVDLEDPPGTTFAPVRIALHGLAVATSGDYRRGAHTIDPRDGRPVSNGIVSASVVHRSAMTADAWASALTVLGVEEAMALGADLGLAARIVATGPRGHEERFTPALVAMLAD